MVKVQIKRDKRIKNDQFLNALPLKGVAKFLDFGYALSPTKKKGMSPLTPGTGHAGGKLSFPLARFLAKQDLL